jgi:hypothetical protein
MLMFGNNFAVTEKFNYIMFFYMNSIHNGLKLNSHKNIKRLKEMNEQLKLDIPPISDPSIIPIFSTRFCHAINGGCIALFKPVFHKSNLAFKELNNCVWM